MKNEAVLYVPADTPDAMALATRPVAGVPLLARGIMTLSRSGIKRVAVLAARSQIPTLRKFLKRYPQHRSPHVDWLAYDEPYRLSPELIDSLLTVVDQRFFLINANLIFDGILLQSMRSFAVSGREMLVCRHGAHPLPFAEITKSALKTLREFAAQQSRSIDSCIEQLLKTLDLSIVQQPEGNRCFLLLHASDVPVAEKFLMESIRHSTSGPVARHLNKRISLPISLMLSKMWISPNVITVVNMFIGLLSGVFIADGFRYTHILFGAFLYQAASVIDGCDGEVSKLTFRSSKFGQYIDTISDNLALGSLMVGMMCGYWRSTHNPLAFVIGGIMIVATLITLGLMVRVLVTRTNSMSLVAYEKEYIAHLPENRSRWVMWFISWAKFTIKKDFLSMAVFVFALFGILYWWLFVTAAGSVIAAAVVSYLTWCDLRGRRILQTAPTEAPATHSAA